MKMQYGATPEGQKELEQKIGYTFHNKALLKQALTHSSYANEIKILKSEDYERLEFLGDAVLELVSSDFLFSEYPQMPEGKLSKLRASLVCEAALAYTAHQLGLERYFLLGKGEESTGGRERPAIACDVVEAVIGAIYLDSGLEEARKFIFSFILDDIETRHLFYDAKSTLQEYVQGSSQGQLAYRIIYEKGPEHDKEFGVELTLDGRVLGRGEGHNKKAAEQQAAYQALRKLHKEDGMTCT
ncbi:MAG: ribonuclease III [Lachnospiraceae bacterium]|nr:ribonuclease III [Lachnospiraceae bacterium]